jgi:hypothetical protein
MKRQTITMPHLPATIYIGRIDQEKEEMREEEEAIIPMSKEYEYFEDMLTTTAIRLKNISIRYKNVSYRTIRRGLRFLETYSLEQYIGK